MTRPFDKFDGIKLHGIDRLLAVVDVVPNYAGAGSWIVIAEDIETLERVYVQEDKCEFVNLGQLSLFDKKEDS